MTMRSLIVIIGSLLLVSGCAHYPVNAPLPVDAQPGYRFQSVASPTNSDDLLFMVAFSGGGTRAAALAYGVLEELNRTEVGTSGNCHRMLDEVDLISSVSGGSFTAAAYALWGDRIFSDFEPRFLKRHVQSGLLLRSLAPWNMIRRASPKFSISDLAAEYYDHLLFKGATFGDLALMESRPYLVINATDVALGARFEFTQDEFDLIQSDLSRFPISRAVAASSAFPVYLSPVVLKNYSVERACVEPEWISSTLAAPRAPSRLKDVALQAHSYRDGNHRRFIHLLDGGVADNLGLRGSVDRAIAYEGSAALSPSVSLQKAKRIAVIIVDAHTDRDYGWDSREGSAGLSAMLGSIGHGVMSRYSFETIELFRETLSRVAGQIEADRLKTGDQQPFSLATYIVELHFNQLPDEANRRFFNSVPTRLQLPATTVDRLRRLAATELEKNEEFQNLVRDLRGSQR